MWFACCHVWNEKQKQSEFKMPRKSRTTMTGRPHGMQLLTSFSADCKLHEFSHITTYSCQFVGLWMLKALLLCSISLILYSTYGNAVL